MKDKKFNCSLNELYKFVEIKHSDLNIESFKVAEIFGCIEVSSENQYFRFYF